MTEAKNHEWVHFGELRVGTSVELRVGTSVDRRRIFLMGFVKILVMFFIQAENHLLP